jgi:lipid-A-disaccharide synthase-like uncharacterized protein
MEVLFFIYGYLLFGLCFAVYFVFVRHKKIDSAAREVSLFFKLLILGGCLLLWPILLTKKEITHT